MHLKKIISKIIRRQFRGAAIAMLMAASIAVHAQWTQSNGPYGGNITALLAVGTDAYAGTLGAGVFKLSSGDTMWRRSATGMNNFFVHALASGNGFLFAGTEHGVFRIALADTVWQAASAGLNDLYITSIAFGSGALYAATNVGTVYVSANNGTTWNAASTGLPASPIQTLIISGTTALVGTRTLGVYRSTNAGVSWSAAHSGMPSNSNVYSLTIGSAGIVAATYLSLGTAYLSTNNGATWTITHFGVTGTTLRSLTSAGTMLYGGANSSLATYRGVYASPDSGASWLEISNGLPANQAFTVNAILASGNTLVAGTDICGAFYSTNGGALWTSFNKGITNLNVTSIAEEDSSLIVGTANLGMFLSNSWGKNWSNEDFNWAGSTIGAVTIVGATAYMCAGNIFSTIDLGADWITVNALPANTVSTFFTAGANLFALTNAPLFYSSTNLGRDWVNASSGLALSAAVNAVITDTAYDYLGTAGNGVYRSSDHGATWSAMNSGLLGQTIYALTISRGIVFAGTNAGLFFTKNNGANWFLDSAGIPATKIYSLAVGAQHILAGLDSGRVYASGNDSSWTLLGGLLSPLPTPLPVVQLVVQGGILFAGLAGDGVWQVPLSSRIFTIDTLRFDTLICETQRNVLFSVLNTGTVPLIISSAPFSGVNASAFILSAPQKFPDTVAVGGSLLFNAYFVPNAVGSMSASMLIINNDLISGDDPKIIVMSAVDESAGLAVQDLLTEIIVHAGASQDSSVVLSATGTAADTVTSAVAASDAPWLSFTQNYFPHAIPAGDSSRLPIHVQATNDTGEVFTTVNFFGSPCSITSSTMIRMKIISGVIHGTSSLAFGNVNAGAEHCDSVRIVNGGNGPLNIVRIAFTGPDSLIFIGTFPHLPAIIAPHDTMLLPICFSPLDSGMKSATLHVGSDDSVSASGEIAVALSGRGIKITGVAESQKIPAEFSLAQNIPNPAATVAQLGFRLDHASQVRIVVRDMLGNIVANICDEAMSAGEHLRNINVDGLRQGVYYYSLTAGGKSLQRMMTIVR